MNEVPLFFNSLLSAYSYFPATSFIVRIPKSSCLHLSYEFDDNVIEFRSCSGRKRTVQSIAECFRLLCSSFSGDESGSLIQELVIDQDRNGRLAVKGRDKEENLSLLHFLIDAGYEIGFSALLSSKLAKSEISRYLPYIKYTVFLFEMEGSVYLHIPAFDQAARDHMK